MILDPLLDFFRGKAITIPPMDGALKPNMLLEEAEVIVRADAPDSVASDGVSVFYASGNSVLRIGAETPAATYPSVITALAISTSGEIAVGLETGAVQVGDAIIEGFNCPTALAFDGDVLLVCSGSEKNPPSQWARDLMQRNASGSVWRVKLADRTKTCLAKNLAWPFGITADARSGSIVFSESWRHRLSAIDAGGSAPKPILSRLPGYPCRLSSTAGGYLLTLFAPLNRLVEFVLQEDAYREDMLRDIEMRHWIAPTLAPSASFLEPLQNGGVRSMGVHKPWSPTRSYGLVVALDTEFRPIASYHSRANGKMHGVTSAIEHKGRIIAASKGGNAILGLDPAGEL